MIVNFLIGASLILLLLAGATALGSFAVGRAHPPGGRFVEVTGGRLHVLELGTRTGAPPVVCCMARAET